MASPSDDEGRLTDLEAYEAMFLFLEWYWERGSKTSDDIAVLLGSMALSKYGTADPAQWDDWQDALNEVRRTKR